MHWKNRAGLIKAKYLICLFFLLLPILSKGEVYHSHSGFFSIATIHRLSDGSIIKMPYRVYNNEHILSVNNFNIVTNMALEFRLKNINQIMNSELTPDLRELYVEWITPFGDISIGKQIITWGSASENNPTDNISPYNYYYLFSLGKERKEGILSLNSIFYLGDIKLNAVFIPKHNSNILPLNDPEFAISSPIVPKDEQIMELDNPYEYGLSMTLPFNSLDITTSYFSGYDRIVSFFGANIWSDKAFTTSTIEPDTVLSYRKTEVLGIGITSFIGDITFRGDFGYFISYDQIKNSEDLKRDFEDGWQRIIEECELLNDNSDNSDQFPGKKICENEPTLKQIFLLDNKVDYSQYILEVEYAPTADLNIISQYSRQKSMNFGIADSLTLSYGTISLDPKQLFIPGMGSPNTFISSNSLSLSARKIFPDNGLEFRIMSMFDLDEKGSLHEAGIEYEINENTNLLIAVNKIFDNKTIQMNPFTGMKDFSHIRLELKYYY